MRPSRQMDSFSPAIRPPGAVVVVISASSWEEARRPIRGTREAIDVNRAGQPRAPDPPILEQRQILAPPLQRGFQESRDISFRYPPLLRARHQRLQVQEPT